MEPPASSSAPLPSRRPRFLPVTLSDDDAARFKAAARALLLRTLDDYDAYAQTPERRVDPARWRVLRTRENLTVYREREARLWQTPPATERLTPRGNSRSNTSATWGPSSSSSSSSSSLPLHSGHGKRSGSTSSSSSSLSSSSSTSHTNPPRVAPPTAAPPPPSVDADDGASTLPRLLSVGSVLGSLDDVMYGVAASDCAAVFLKAAYAHDDLVDADVLCKLEGPSPRDPFRFLGVKWLVKATKTSGVNKLVAPRDLVYVEATGVLVRPARDVDAGPGDFDRIGFQVMVSVQLPSVGELSDSHGIVRARTESCYLFKGQKKKKPASGGADTGSASAASCEVYATSWVDPRGKVSESVALHSVSNTLLYVGSVVHCGQRKKLAWRLTTDTHGGNVIMQMNDERAAPARACGICGKSFKSGLLHKRRHAVECKLCFKAMCSRCCVTQTIFFADTSPRRRKTCKQVTPKQVELCKSCITSTAQASALDIARAEVMSGRFGRVLRHDRGPSSKPSEHGNPHASTRSATNGPSGAQKAASSRPAVGAERSNDDGSHEAVSGSSRGHYAQRQPAGRPDAPRTNSSHREDRGEPSRSQSSHDASSPEEQASLSSSRGLGSSHGLPVVLLDPGLDDELSSSRRVKPSNSIASRSSSKSSSSSSGRAGAYDSEIEDDFDDVDEVLETANMRHVPHPGAFKSKLFMQMAELRSVAEDVYQYARTNTAVHLTASSGSARAVRNSDVSFDD